MSSAKKDSHRPGTVSLPTGDVKSVVQSADGDAALLYLYIAANGDAADKGAMARALGFSLSRLEKALEALFRLGAVPFPLAQQLQRPSAEKSHLPPQFLEKNAEFKELCQCLEKALGRLLRRGEVQSVYQIYTELHMPADMIMLLIKSMEVSGVPITAKSLEREACRWVDDGVSTYEEAEVRLSVLERKKSQSAQVMSLFKIYNRLPSPTEEKYIETWLEMGFSPEALEAAYDKTVINTGSLKWSYLNKILTSWHEKGLHTLEAVRGEPAPGQLSFSSQKARPAGASGALSEFELASIARAKSRKDAKKEG